MTITDTAEFRCSCGIAPDSPLDAHDYECPVAAAAELGADPTQLVQLLLAASGEDPDGPQRMAAGGTFAMYPDGRGGLVVVMDIQEGMPAMLGVHKAAIPSALIRTVMALAGQGTGLVARMARRHRRAADKAIEQG